MCYSNSHFDSQLTFKTKLSKSLPWRLTHINIWNYHDHRIVKGRLIANTCSRLGFFFGWLWHSGGTQTASHLPAVSGDTLNRFPRITVSPSALQQASQKPLLKLKKLFVYREDFILINYIPKHSHSRWYMGKWRSNIKEDWEKLLWTDLRTVKQCQQNPNTSEFSYLQDTGGQATKK